LERARRGHADAAKLVGFEFEEELGRGGMGAVCLIRKEDERLTIKVLLPRVASVRAAYLEACKRFVREAKVTRKLQHPNIVRFHDAGYALEIPWYTMEYCDGGSVGKLLAERGGRVQIEEAVPIALQALDGLRYAHEHEVIHRDLKPANLFLAGTDANRRAKVADFGLARTQHEACLTPTGTSLGSFEFMCRRQLVDSKRVGPEVDIWGMAATLYAMLTGTPPRDFAVDGGGNWANRCRMIILRNDPVPISDREPSIPHRLAQVIDAALDETRTRFATAAEFRNALEKART
jgi:serine/threonine protein kinase